MIRTVALEQIADINPRPPKELADDDLVSFLPMAAITENGQIDASDERMVREARKGFTYFKRGDFLLAKITPCFENGKAALTSTLPHEHGFGSTEFHVIRAHNDIADAKYLSYLLRSNEFKFLGEHSMYGAAGQQRVSLDFIKQYPVFLPPLEEQCRIAAILDKADAIRRKRRRAIELTETFLRSMFLDMFGDPVKNQKGWKKIPLGELCTIRRGASPRPISEFLGGTVPWIKIGDGTKGDLIYIKETKDNITEEGASKSVYLEPGTLIFANCGVSLGFARILSIGGCIHDGWLSFESLDASIDKIFLLKLLNFVTEHFRHIAPDGTQPNLNTGIMKAFEILVPPMRLQKKYLEIFEHLNLSGDRIRQALISTEFLFASLTQQAFRGELNQSATPLKEAISA